MKYRTQKLRKNRHLRTIVQLCQAISSQLRHSWQSEKKNLINSKISSTCPHNMVNFGPLKAEIGWQFWGTPGNFNGFRILTSLLHQHRSKGGQPNFARRFFISWAGTQYLHFGGLVPPNRILPGAKFTLCQSCVLRIGSITAWHSSSGRRPNFTAWYKEGN